ncbi:DcaP family trimeric outer membrane transporter [Shewanella fidelis]|uniref:DcaP family trimeric outer membrane transporter n=1 Tax=Shewanella fidelis TaxID=173509 RepID=A0AAW8NVD1_9GAMM|nr:DcaP family trimeric outer membrane transporter [Shewanella fidelis]MDR8526166.1 DcaP family trimeric outer membrane transporter [Shewanella fidelis]MDW4813779.1 DcaP family trimeric outer membrane transporter [Shewanella fidelis]MDW4817875.1 DcaP family trimeric outer membrane transporter [Shewanella fidelis]MDW4821864.1 DcaP family trimeric outer membrane transporter [Shewanella fidelis]MDW4826107.1 DcaP family trimeric outer membrane transporter [Shewanella fidelis]
MKSITKASICICLITSFSPLSMATEYHFGGFIKANARYVDGNIAFQDSWTGGGSIAESAKRTQFSAAESRFNVGITHGDVFGFAEIDFSGSSQGNAVFSNSYSPRLRHAYIKYDGFTAGQTWSTMVNTSTFAETADLGVPLAGQAMVRQTLVRYSNDSWQFALENPYTYGTQAGSTDADKKWVDTSNDYVPDAVIRFDKKGDWGNISVSSLLRYLDPQDSAQFGAGVSVAAKLNTIGKDDLRLQLHYGNLGRYVGTDAARDMINGEIETTKAAMFAYRHFWTERTRSSLFYGVTMTEEEQTDRFHAGVNLFTNLTPVLALGFELGRYQIDDGQNPYTGKAAPQGASNYAQLSLQFHI